MGKSLIIHEGHTLVESEGRLVVRESTWTPVFTMTVPEGEYLGLTTDIPVFLDLETPGGEVPSASKVRVVAKNPQHTDVKVLLETTLSQFEPERRDERGLSTTLEHSVAVAGGSTLSIEVCSPAGVQVQADESSFQLGAQGAPVEMERADGFSKAQVDALAGRHAPSRGVGSRHAESNVIHATLATSAPTAPPEEPEGEDDPVVVGESDRSHGRVRALLAALRGRLYWPVRRGEGASLPTEDARDSYEAYFEEDEVRCERMLTGLEAWWEENAPEEGEEPPEVELEAIEATVEG